MGTAGFPDAERFERCDRAVQESRGAVIDARAGLRHNRGLHATRSKRNRGGEADGPAANYDCIHALISDAALLHSSPHERSDTRDAGCRVAHPGYGVLYTGGVRSTGALLAAATIEGNVG